MSKLSSKNICDKMIDSIYYYMSVLKNTCNGEFNKSIKKDAWKMSEYKNEQVNNYLSINMYLIKKIRLFLRRIFIICII